MDNAKMTAVTFDNSDVIATSGGVSVRNVVTMIGAFDTNPTETLVNHLVVENEPDSQNRDLATIFNETVDKANGLTSTDTLKSFVRNMYLQNESTDVNNPEMIDATAVDNIYSVIRGATFQFNGTSTENDTYKGVRTSEGRLWIDRNGDGIFSGEKEYVTLTDVIHSTTGTRAEINVTGASEAVSTPTEYYWDYSNETLALVDNDVSNGVIKSGVFSAAGIPETIQYKEAEYSLTKVDGGVLTYASEGQTLTYTVTPTFFDDPTDGQSLNPNYLEGTQKEKTYMEDNPDTNPSTTGFQAGQVESLAELFKSTVWTYNPGSFTFSNETTLEPGEGYKIRAKQS